MSILTTVYGKKICAGSRQKCTAAWHYTEGFTRIYHIDGKKAIRIR